MFYENKILYKLNRAEMPEMVLPSSDAQKKAQESFMSSGIGPFEISQKEETRFINQLAGDYHNMKLNEFDSAINPVHLGMRVWRSAIGNVFGKKGETFGRRAFRLGANFLTPFGIPYQVVKTGYEAFKPNVKGAANLGKNGLGQIYHRGAKPITVNTLAAVGDGLHLTANTGLGIVNTAAWTAGKAGKLLGFVPRIATAPIAGITGREAPDQWIAGMQDGMSKWGGGRWEASKDRYGAIGYDAGQIWQRGKNITTSAFEAPGRAVTTALGEIVDTSLGQGFISPFAQGIRDSNFPQRVFGNKKTNINKSEPTAWEQKYGVSSQIPDPSWEPNWPQQVEVNTSNNVVEIDPGKVKGLEDQLGVAQSQIDAKNAKILELQRQLAVANNSSANDDGNTSPNAQAS
jgi:hypothetical protein